MGILGSITKGLSSALFGKNTPPVNNQPGLYPGAAGSLQGMNQAASNWAGGLGYSSPLLQQGIGAYGDLAFGQNPWAQQGLQGLGQMMNPNSAMYTGMGVGSQFDPAQSSQWVTAATNAANPYAQLQKQAGGLPTLQSPQVAFNKVDTGLTGLEQQAGGLAQNYMKPISGLSSQAGMALSLLNPYLQQNEDMMAKNLKHMYASQNSTDVMREIARGIASEQDRSNQVRARLMLDDLGQQYQQQQFGAGLAQNLGNTQFGRGVAGNQQGMQQAQGLFGMQQGANQANLANLGAQTGLAQMGAQYPMDLTQLLMGGSQMQDALTGNAYTRYLQGMGLQGDILNQMISGGLNTENQQMQQLLGLPGMAGAPIGYGGSVFGLQQGIGTAPYNVTSVTPGQSSPGFLGGILGQALPWAIQPKQQQPAPQPPIWV